MLVDAVAVALPLPTNKGTNASCYERTAQETKTTAFIELDLELQCALRAEKWRTRGRLEHKTKYMYPREEEAPPVARDGLEVFISLLLYNRMAVHLMLGRGQWGDNWYFET